MRRDPWLPAAILLLTTTGCESGGVGDPCIPEDEHQAGFSGYSLQQVNIESRSFQCETRICLVNHFQGRVSCPFGQTEEDLSLPASERCRLPGTTGTDSRDGVNIAVEPWDVDRPPPESVYCSCRCAGDDPNARYCSCPSGFECLELFPKLALPGLAGSYCIKRGTEFAPHQVGGPTCADTPEDPRCSRGVDR